MSKLDKPSEEDLGWHVTRRWQSYEGEIRAAILRAGLVLLFYSIQLIHYFCFSDRSETSLSFHREVTFICVVWLLVSLGVLVALRQRIFPWYLKYCTTTFDLCLLTVCAGLGSGPSSPLIHCLGLVIVLAALRASLALIWHVTLTAMACYVALVGVTDPTWFDKDHVTDPTTQLITLAALAATGIASGQIVRLFRKTAVNYSARIQSWQSPGKRPPGAPK